MRGTCLAHLAVEAELAAQAAGADAAGAHVYQHLGDVAPGGLVQVQEAQHQLKVRDDLVLGVEGAVLLVELAAHEERGVRGHVALLKPLYLEVLG